MPEKDPFNYSLLTYTWVFLLAAWGGTVNFVRKMKTGKVRVFNITELVGEIVTSAFVGILTFWLCEASNIEPLVTAALVGVSGHMGSRGLFMLEHMASKRFGVDIPNDRD